MTAIPYPLRIGTRGSALALAQAEEVKTRLIQAWPELAVDGAVEIVPMTTTGDTIQDRSLAEIGGKGLFTKEIEEALMTGTVHIAVHSMKDMPAELPAGLVIECLLPREDARDAFISPNYGTIAALPAGAVIGTSSVRRQAQLLAIRPDINVITFRGNVGTRLEKLQAGQADGTLLAMAGLRRIGQEHRVTEVVEFDRMLPAVAQGAIGVECRAGDSTILSLLAAIHDPVTGYAITAERGFLKELEGSCKTPIAAHAVVKEGKVHLRALIITPDGTVAYSTERTGSIHEAEALGREAGKELRARDKVGIIS